VEDSVDLALAELTFFVSKLADIADPNGNTNDVKIKLLRRQYRRQYRRSNDCQQSPGGHTYPAQAANRAEVALGLMSRMLIVSIK
jgi:hypothetical protein